MGHTVCAAQSGEVAGTFFLGSPRALAAPSISIGDVAVVEANAGTVAAVFTVTLSEASLDTVSALVSGDGTFELGTGTRAAATDH